MPAESSRSPAFDIAIVCALSKPELAAVRRIGDWTELPAERNDPTMYFQSAHTTRKGMRLTFVGAAATQMGMPAAAVLATKMIRRFHPKLVAIVGVAAGVKTDRQGFGDVLAPSSTFDYGSGKITAEDEKLRFAPDPNALRIEPRLLARLMHWSPDHPSLDAIQRDWQGATPQTRLRLHVGPLGSGSAVLGTSLPIDDIRNQARKLIGVEMEAYGVHLACRESFDPAPMFLCMKSICDFAAGKNDDWQDYAAYTAAQLCVRFLLEEWESLFFEPSRADESSVTQTMRTEAARCFELMSEVAAGISNYFAATLDLKNTLFDYTMSRPEVAEYASESLPPQLRDPVERAMAALSALRAAILEVNRHGFAMRCWRRSVARLQPKALEHVRGELMRCGFTAMESTINANNLVDVAALLEIAEGHLRELTFLRPILTVLSTNMADTPAVGKGYDNAVLRLFMFSGNLIFNLSHSSKIDQAIQIMAAMGAALLYDMIGAIPSAATVEDELRAYYPGHAIPAPLDFDINVVSNVRYGWDALRERFDLLFLEWRG